MLLSSAVRMTGFCSEVLWLLVFSSAEAALFGERGELRSPDFASPSSFEAPGDVCLNGGTSFPSLSTGRHMFCLCPDGFEGKSCETAAGSRRQRRRHCYEGVGLFYRGSESTSGSGQTCQEWDAATRERYLTSDLNSGKHNYCRNVGFKRGPWCYVWKNRQLVWEYCNIPRCYSEILTASPSPAPPQPVAEQSCGRRHDRKLMKIVGGAVATVESHPWVAAIFWRSKSQVKVLRCGGSLISSCWVLTAAHCFPDWSPGKARRFSVTLGKNSLNVTDIDVEQRFRVEDIIIHDGFDNSDGSFNHDIALVKLKARRGQCAQQSDWVRTVCLPPPTLRLQPGLTCEIAGYGRQEDGSWLRSETLREAHVDLLADGVCRQSSYYGEEITDNMFCAARPDWSQDACQGDSGGPLVCPLDGRLLLYGVISWGDGCAQELRPGVYTRVTNYNRWIEEKMSPVAVETGSPLESLVL